MRDSARQVEEVVQLGTKDHLWGSLFVPRDINPSALPASVQLCWDPAWPWGSESATAVAIGEEHLSTEDLTAQRELGAEILRDPGPLAADS